MKTEFRDFVRVKTYKNLEKHTKNIQRSQFGDVDFFCSFEFLYVYVSFNMFIFCCNFVAIEQHS